MSIQQTIGRNIVHTRKEKKISQEQLALGSEMSVSYLRTIEHGAANPTVDALRRIAETLGTSFNDIVRITKEGE